jgi:hypothetical protein
MSHAMILQIPTQGLFDPLAILFFLGAGLFLYGCWVVLRRPTTDDEVPGREGGSRPAAPQGRKKGDAR